MADFINLPCRDDDGHFLVVVEAPRGSWVKMKYDPAKNTFVFKRPLVLGVTYPFDWGFIPSTRADDGDPLDAIVRLLQRDGKKAPRQRNDRIIAVPAEDLRFKNVTDLPKRVREELEQFFISASAMSDKKVVIEGWDGPKAARKTIDEAATKYIHRGIS